MITCQFYHPLAVIDDQVPSVLFYYDLREFDQSPVIQFFKLTFVRL